MKVGIGMSSNLSKKELHSLLQVIKTWGEELGDKEVGFTFNVPELEREEVKELLRDIYPLVEEFTLTPAPSSCFVSGHQIQSGRRSPPGERLLRFGPRTVVVGDSMLGICGDLAITITEATDEEIERFENASEIRLVKIMKG